MDFVIQTNAGPLARLLEEDASTLAKSTRSVVLRSGTTIKNAVRRIIGRAGLGKLARAVQRTTPGGTGRGLVEVRVAVISKAIVKRAGGVFDLVLVFAEGATIKPVNRQWLALPFAGIGLGPRGRKLTPEDFGGKAGGKFVFVPISGNRMGLLIDKETRRPFFLLLRRTRLRARLDLAPALALLNNIIPNIIRDWERRRSRQAAARLAA